MTVAEQGVTVTLPSGMAARLRERLPLTNLTLGQLEDLEAAFAGELKDRAAAIVLLGVIVEEVFLDPKVTVDDLTDADHDFVLDRVFVALAEPRNGG